MRDAPPEEILNALIGVRLGPDDLRALLSGCVKSAAEAAGGRSYGSEWIAIDLKSGGVIYLRRQTDAWRIVAGRYGGLEIDYTAFAGERPSQVVLRGTGVNLALSLSQIEVNGQLPGDQLVALKVPEGAVALSLDELRQLGPLGQ